MEDYWIRPPKPPVNDDEYRGDSDTEADCKTMKFQILDRNNLPSLRY